MSAGTNREDSSFPLRDVAFQNIHFVSSTVKATNDIVESLESDIQDIKAAVQLRKQSSADQAQLIRLLQIENRTLQQTTEVLQLELSRAHQEYAEELEQHTAGLQAELERISSHCTQALEERNKYALYAQQLEAQNKELRAHHEDLAAQSQRLQAENDYLRQQQEPTKRTASQPSEPILEHLHSITSRLTLLEAENSVMRARSARGEIQVPRPLSPHLQDTPAPSPLPAVGFVCEDASTATKAATLAPVEVRVPAVEDSRAYELDSPRSDDEGPSRAYGLQSYNIPFAASNRYGYGDDEADDDDDVPILGNGRQASSLHHHSHGYDLQEPDSYDDIRLTDILQQDFR